MADNHRLTAYGSMGSLERAAVVGTDHLVSMGKIHGIFFAHLLDFCVKMWYNISMNKWRNNNRR
jgi:hypothetical protein